LPLPHETIVSLLEGVDFFEPLSADELDALARKVETVHWDAGVSVFEEGDRGSVCYVIDTGRVKVTRRLADGQPITLAQFGHCGVVGELALLAGDRRSASMETIEPTTAVEIASEDLMGILQSNAKAAIGMAAHIADLLREANDRVFTSTTSSSNGRILATLLSQVEARQARSPGEEEVELVGSMTDLARLSGAARDDAARVLHWLENEGVITLKRGRIVVHSPDALRGQLG
jgi:CRP/FNR family transcriptional regulator, cyclic AMP receptor protein